MIDAAAPLGRRSVGALFAGPAADGGFMQSGHAALQRAAQAADIAATYIDGIPPQHEALTAALRRLAEAGHGLVIAHGGQNNDAALEVAGLFPHVAFAVTQGQVRAANVASYDVMQEHSAFLAGMLAARTTRTGTVAHLSGIRVRPGLKGRAAFAHGVRHVDPAIRFVTEFCGHQDDNAIAEAAADRLIGQGADVMFTMLNSGRSGAIAACRARACQQIGNVDDWTQREPDVFIGSALADVGMGVERAINDFAGNRFPANGIVHIGLETASAVGLAMGARVTDAIRAQINAAADDIRSGRLTVDTVWAEPG